MPRRQDDTGQPMENLNYRGSLQFPTSDQASPQVVYEEDQAWLPLAGLFSRLILLSDLTYDCPNQFSPCLLQALHKHHPTCRLHLERYQLLSVNFPEPDAHEVALSTSPCLYSIKASYSHTTRDNTINFTHNAVLEMIAGLAPNLRKLSLHWTRPPARARSPTLPGNACRSLKPQQHRDTQIQGSSLGSLEELHVNNPMIGDMASWALATDMSVLRVLTIQDDHIDVRTLDYLASHCNLSSLKELSFSTLHFAAYQPQTPVDDGICRLLRNLPPLTHFRLNGNITRVIFDAVISHQGSELQELNLNVTEFHIKNVILGQHDIQMISENCPKLESLAISIPRSGGDADEVAIYKSLGSIKRLQRLSLKLDASSLEVAWIYNQTEEHDKYKGGGYDGETDNNSSFDSFQADFYPYKLASGGRKLRNGHVMNSLIKSAMDENVARSIFEVITSGKPAGSVALESLSISILGGHVFGHASALYGEGSQGIGIGNVITAISRAFKIERDPRDDLLDELFVMDMTPPWVIEMTRESKKLDHFAEQIFRRVWPGSGEGDSKWGEDWSSFPLQETR
jgi:hypothetical protein